MNNKKESDIIIKICGLRRSGTNFITNFLKEYFFINENENVKILTLSKHCPMYNYKNWLDNKVNWNQRESHAGLNDFIYDNFIGNRWYGEFDGNDSYHFDKTYKVKKEKILEAIQKDNFYTIFCVRDPISLIHSQIKFFDFSLNTYSGDMLYQQCAALNYFYTDVFNWSAKNSVENKSVIIPIENFHMTESFINKYVLPNFEKLFKRKALKRYTFQDKCFGSKEKNKKFNLEYIAKKQYLEDFKVSQLNIIKTFTDWEFFENVGYEKFEFKCLV
jgi:hypothetical protein